MPTDKCFDGFPPRTKTPGEAPFKWPLRRSRALALVSLFTLYLIFTTSRKQLVSPNTCNPDGADWSRYAYSLYATDSATVCHAVLVFDALERLGSRADRVLFYPEYWDTVVESAIDRDSQLLVLARDKYRVKLHATKVLSVQGIRTPSAPKQTWDDSVTKFLAFGLTKYHRVLHLDSDITLLQHLDELFFLPTPIAMPRAYWSDFKPWPLTSLLMLLEPNTQELEGFKTSIKAGAEADVVTSKKYDMDLLNERFSDSALVLPHRPYALLTGEFRSHDHSAYLGNNREEWDPDRILKEAKLVHFSDWPLPKPWIMWPSEGLAQMQPDCGGKKEGTCRERVIWKDLYDDFRQRRRDICKLLSVPAPDWASLTGKGKAVHNITSAAVP